ncbi:hypothetical protein E2I00_003455 [Balaenoptera physalus]|uniref:Centrosomal protein of 131 kDa n=1 Tax=Balaenoptera physalus TaxID=9770 RepID=A0A643C4L7_BALPH|nr:hypothetical protein E2I00_003455 [Balaenoptera physalus]
MKGSRALSGPSGPPEGSPESTDLSLTGLPPPMSRRPNSASTAKPIARSISVVTGSEPRRKMLEAPGPGGSRAVSNLRRSNSATQVNQPQASQAWPGPLRPEEPLDFLTLFEGSPGGRKRPASLSKASSEKGATWNVLDDQPRAFTLPPDAQSPGTLDVLVGPRRRECTVPLAPNFTANNRSNKGAVGNCVTTMVHNHYTPSEKVPPPKSSNHMAPSLNNIIKAATDEGEGGSLGKPQKNAARSNHTVQNNSGGTAGQLRRKEVTEEEAERFIHQVNQAAITIQRWYRHQVQRRRARAARLEHLLASKREGQRQRLGEGTLLDQHQQKEVARRKAREEKARQARRAAIQELQQKRAQKSGNADRGLLKRPGETGKPQTTQEPTLRPGSAAQQTHKANNTGEQAYHKDKYAWTDEEDDSSSLTADNLEKFGKLSGPMPEEGLGRLEPASEVSTSVMRLQLEVEEKKQAMVLLQRALAQQRDLTIRRVKETEKELGRQLRQQKEHYEATIQRHLSFIDQLIEDKKALGEKCEALVTELKQGDQRLKDKEAQMQEQHELEIKKLKELMSATEKVRREKWINEKTRKIKEITVKGLEPEIQKLIAKHKQEVKKLKSLHAMELKALKDQLEVEKQMWEANSAKKEVIPKSPCGHPSASSANLSWPPKPSGPPLQEAWLLNRERELKEEIRRGRDKEIELVIHRLEADMTLAREENERAAESRVKRLRDKYEAELSELEQSERKLQERCAELKGRLGEAEGENVRLQGLVNEQLAGERSSLAQGALPKGHGFTWGQPWGHRSCHWLLQAAQCRNQQGWDKVGRSGPSCSSGDGGPPPATLLHSELQAGMGVWQGHRTEAHRTLPRRVKLALAKKEEAVSSLRKQHEVGPHGQPSWGSRGGSGLTRMDGLLQAAMKRADHLEELLEQRRRPFPSAK